jgi:acyl-CoA synthetase (AMP-forming)/AMP-acid ligase II
MVEFIDGSVLAQLSHSDMCFPIQYAVTWPQRVKNSLRPLDFAALRQLDFEAPRRADFPAIDLAVQAGTLGGTLPAVYNAANEIAVAAFIEGRLSRFSKIGGEMVPHEAVEEHINRALGLEGEDQRKIAVVGVPDPDKGEALVLLSTVAGETYNQELIQLRYALLDRGVPALWIPKKVLRVSEIPVLASGKMDLRKCEELARAATV